MVNQLNFFICFLLNFYYCLFLSSDDNFASLLSFINPKIVNIATNNNSPIGITILSTGYLVIAIMLSKINSDAKIHKIYVARVFKTPNFLYLILYLNHLISFLHI